MYNQISSPVIITSKPLGSKASNRFLNDPIFYSVFFGLISFTFYVISTVNGYFFDINEYKPSYTFIILNLFSVLTCFLSPLIIKLISPKYSLISCIILLLLGYLLCVKTFNIGSVGFGRFITVFSEYLSSICILSGLIIVNWESKYLIILFGVFYFVGQVFSISIQYISFFGNQFFGPFIALILLALVFAISLSQPESDCEYVSANNSNVSFNTCTYHHRSIISKESKFLYLVPILLFLGSQTYFYSPIIASIAVIPIVFIIYKWGRLKLYYILLVLAVISIVCGFISVYSNYGYYDQRSFYIYSSGIIQFINIVCVVTYTTFSIGTSIIIFSMMATGQVFPKESIISIVSAIQGVQLLGGLITSICLYYISSWFLWYLANVLYISGGVLFLVYLKDKVQHISCCD